MKYISTRSGDHLTNADACPAVDFTTALMQGLAPDGGLYVPAEFPRLAPLKKDATYLETALAVMGAFTEGCIDAPTLRTLLTNAYAPRTDGFTTSEITPLKPLTDRLSVLELFHGPTIAFKDVALQLLGQLFDHRLKATGRTMTILGATSGDTGSAAIEGCRHAAGADIFILYPHERPSEVQRRQMTTVRAPNVRALAVRGNFDDCQAIVKMLFNDRTFRQEARLSAVNSINWARIAAQVVYYVHTAYRYDEPVTFIVPTGNFGNVYAAYVARKMGAPIRGLVVASNRNDILTRFLETGTMKTSTVLPSLSPSMDIQVSSNFERLLFDLVGRDPATLKTLMSEFTQSGSYTLGADRLSEATSLFTGVRCDDEQTLAAIARTHRDFGYLIDPHTAVAFHAWERLRDSIRGPVVALACAHPAKFPDAVEQATGIRPALPEALAGLYDRPEHFDVLDNSPEAVRAFIETRRAGAAGPRSEG